MSIIKYKNCFISHTASAVGKAEADGPLGSMFDLLERDAYFGEPSWEKAESELLRRTINILLKKSKKRRKILICCLAVIF